jgi:hypothetical protein
VRRKCVGVRSGGWTWADSLGHLARPFLEYPLGHKRCGDDDA